MGEGLLVDFRFLGEGVVVDLSFFEEGLLVDFCFLLGSLDLATGEADGDRPREWLPLA